MKSSLYKHRVLPLIVFAYVIGVCCWDGMSHGYPPPARGDEVVQQASYDLPSQDYQTITIDPIDDTMVETPIPPKRMSLVAPVYLHKTPPKGTPHIVNVSETTSPPAYTVQQPSACIPTVRGTDPASSISGPDSIEANQAGMFKYSGAKGESYRWLIIPEEADAWFTPILIDQQDANGETQRGGVLIPLKKIEVHIEMIVVAKDFKSIATVKTVNKNLTPGPTPPPEPPVPPKPPVPPEPPVPPKPPVPDNAWAKWTVESVTKTVSLPPEQRKATGAALATALETVCKAVDNGEITDLKIAREKLAKQSYDAVSEADRKAWSDFSSAMDVEVKKYVQAGKAQSVKDYADVWKNIAIGLRAL